MDIKKYFSILLLLFLIGLKPAYANAILTTNNFETVVQKVLQLIQRYGKDQVLLVLDNDNTLTTMPQYLGSVVWLDWQFQLLKATPDNAYLVGRDTQQLLAAQRLLFRTSKMQLTEPRLDLLIKKIQDTGIHVIVLTARSPVLSNITQIQFKQNNLQFLTSALTPKKGFAGTYLPYEKNNLAAYGVTKQQAKQLRLPKPRPVRYENGVFYASDQNKGIMLETLLHKTKHHFKAIIFIDDRLYNVEAMYNVFKNKPVDIVVYRYTRLDKFNKDFSQAEKLKTYKQWQKLQKTLERVFKLPQSLPKTAVA
ncbi:MAG: DUF2608 domain-containing protein [Pseudomonadota bacterium]